MEEARRRRRPHRCRGTEEGWSREREEEAVGGGGHRWSRGRGGGVEGVGGALGGWGARVMEKAG
jgi:hypothetical protein